jgi:hypothetical protein
MDRKLAKRSMELTAQKVMSGVNKGIARLQPKPLPGCLF